jgi:hypothetical protein
MQFIINTTKQEVSTAVAALLDALALAFGAEQEAFNFEINLGTPVKAKRESRKGISIGARIQYRAVLPAEPTARQKVIADNLGVLGVGTMKAMVYEDIIKGNDAGQIVTKAMIQKLRSCAASSAERMIGDLVRGGIVVSEPIVFSGNEKDAGGATIEG